jgi:glutathione S-transferase
MTCLRDDDAGDSDRSRNMTRYRLTYFDIDGGRAEPIRIAFHKAGIAFEDERLSFDDYMKARDNTRFGALPELEIDGNRVSQSNAIGRFVARKAGLYPDDELQALYCDEVVGAVEDTLHAIGTTFGLEGEQLEAARQRLVDGKLTTYLRGIGELLVRGGDFFADNRLTIADLKVLVLTRWLCSGKLDHVPTDLVSRVAPQLTEHLQRVESDPVVAAYYASRG